MVYHMEPMNAFVLWFWLAFYCYGTEPIFRGGNHYVVILTLSKLFLYKSSYTGHTREVYIFQNIFAYV